MRRVIGFWLFVWPPFMRRAERARGQSLTEFALALPVLALVMLIGLDFGRALMSYVTLQQTARAGANYAASATYLTWGAMQQSAYRAAIQKEAAGINCDLPDPPPDPQLPGNPPVLGQPVAVRLTCQFHVLTPFLDLFLPNPLVLGTTATFPVTHVYSAGPPGPGGGVPGGGSSATIGTQPISATGTAPFEVQFLDLTAQQPNQPVSSSWTWNFGDGSNTGCPSQSSDTTDVTNWHNPCHLFINNGSTTLQRTVTLTACNPSGCVSGTKTVNVQSSAPAPVACFTMSPTSGTVPQPVNFNSTCTTASPTSWHWVFGDLFNGQPDKRGCAGETDVTALQNPCHRYTTAGTFQVTLTATNAVGPGSVTHPITINNPPSCGPVPNFVGQAARPNNFTVIQNMWAAPGFTGPIVWSPSTPTSNTGNHSVTAQSPTAGTFQVCSVTLTLTWK